MGTFKVSLNFICLLAPKAPEFFLALFLGILPKNMCFFQGRSKSVPYILVPESVPYFRVGLAGEKCPLYMGTFGVPYMAAGGSNCPTVAGV